MRFLDANEVAEGSTLHCDVCVVGAGPAGLAVATRLGAVGVSVCLMEGDASRQAATSDVEVVGHPLNTDAPRLHRGIGGTTELWYGRCAAFEPSDFGERHWVPDSGWPMPFEEYARHLPAAAEFLGVPGGADPELPVHRQHRAHDLLRKSSLAPKVHVWTRDPFLRRRTTELRAARTVRLFRGAVATRLVGTEGDRHVDRLRFVTLTGAAFSVKARAYVLCAGGLENARLMLASRDGVPAGFANHHDSLGRYYMNHPHNEGLARLHLAPGHPDAATLLERLDRRHDSELGTIVQFGIGLDEDFARRHRLLNGCSFVYARLAGALRPAADAVNDFRRELARGRPSRGTLGVAGRLLANAPGLLQAAHHRMRSRELPIEHHVVVDQLEQVPDRDSRVTLASRLDAFGVPNLRLDWKVGPETTATLRALHGAIARAFGERGWGRLDSPLLTSSTLVPDYTDAAHPSGTTRMSLDPRTGVVDRNARVHGVDNLFVCGSSIFPTAGHASPTLTIIALALRLADHVGARFHALGSARGR